MVSNVMQTCPRDLAFKHTTITNCTDSSSWVVGKIDSLTFEYQASRITLRMTNFMIVTCPAKCTAKGRSIPIDFTIMPNVGLARSAGFANCHDTTFLVLRAYSRMGLYSSPPPSTISTVNRGVSVSAQPSLRTMSAGTITKRFFALSCIETGPKVADDFKSDNSTVILGCNRLLTVLVAHLSQAGSSYQKDQLVILFHLLLCVLLFCMKGSKRKPSGDPCKAIHTHSQHAGSVTFLRIQSTEFASSKTE